MKKILVGALILASLTGCSFLDRAKENVKSEVSNTDIAVVNQANGYIYYEDGTFYYKADVYATPRKVELEDVAMYSAKVLLK